MPQLILVPSVQHFYILGFVLAFVLAIGACPIFRWIALRYNIIDHPHLPIKTHFAPTPYLGGAGIGLAFISSLIIACIFLPYPLSSFRSMLGILLGGFLILLLGLADDIIADGLSFKQKFAVQFIVSVILLSSGLQIDFIHPQWLAYVLTIVWIIGIMNAINIIDIMDGLAGCSVIVALFAFFFITLPTEEIYINLMALLLAGALLGFLPYNFSKNNKMFMGDTGSLFLGYVLSVLSLSTKYPNEYTSIMAPILILGVPIYDTFLVMLLRYRKGISLFHGSKDHFAIRLRKMGFSCMQINLLAVGASVFFCFCAWLITQLWLWGAIAICALVVILSVLVGIWLAQVEVDK